MEFIKKLYKSKKFDEINNFIKKSRDFYYNPPLSKDITKNDEKYMLTDKEYDEIIEYLKLKPEFKNIDKLIGAEFTNIEGKTVNHKYKMGSLKKYKENNLRIYVDFIKKQNLCKKPLLIMEKIDGISFELKVKNGKYVKGSTRGDGNIGKDLTNYLSYFNLPVLPKTITDIYIRGELVFYGEDLQGYNNRRNAVAGIVNSVYLTGNIAKLKLIKKFIKFIAFGIIFKGSTDDVNEVENLILLKKFNFNIPKHLIFDNCNVLNIAELNKIHFNLKEKTKKDHDIDGLVITPVNHPFENVAIPKYKVAFKIQTENYESEVEDIDWNISKNSVLIPTIIIKPIVINNKKITKVSGFNFDFIRRHKISKGSIINITLSNEIIPVMTGVKKINENTTFKYPKTCPICKGKTLKKGVNLICPSTCSKYKNIEFFLQKLGSKGLKISTISSLDISSYDKLFNLNFDNIEKLPGFGAKKISNIKNEINKIKTKKYKPEVLLSALNIENFGEKMMKKILSIYSIEDLLTKKINSEKIIDLEGFSNILTDSFIEKLPELRKRLKEVLKYINYTKNVNDTDIKKIVLTGKYDKMTRNELKDLLFEKGYEVVQTVSNKVCCVLTDDKNSTTGKIKTAKQKNIEIKTYDEFLS